MPHRLQRAGQPAPRRQDEATFGPAVEREVVVGQHQEAAFAHEGHVQHSPGHGRRLGGADDVDLAGGRQRRPGGQRQHRRVRFDRHRQHVVQAARRLLDQARRDDQAARGLGQHGQHLEARAVGGEAGGGAHARAGQLVEVEGQGGAAPGAVDGGGELHRAALCLARDLAREGIRQPGQGDVGPRGHGQPEEQGQQPRRAHAGSLPEPLAPPLYACVMALVDRINADLLVATKAQASLRMNTLRMAKAALKNREIDKHAPLDDGEAVRVLQQLVKQREDSAAQYRSAGRTDLADKEVAEIVVLKDYLPQDVGDDEIDAAVEAAVAETGATSAKDMGKVMKAALAALQASGKAVDGKRVNEAVRARLAG